MQGHARPSPGHAEVFVIKLFEKVGQSTTSLLERFGQLVTLTGQALALMLTGRLHPRNTLTQLAFIGVDSLPIALLITLSVGMVFALQITNEFITYGATSAIGGVVAVALAREMAPIMVGVVVAGRVGAAITAEIGSMKVTEQIDALESFAVDPIRYLVVPRLFACMVMVPLMVVLGDIIGLTGGYFIVTELKGITGTMYLDSIRTFLSVPDVLKGMFKGILFGGIVAVIGCYEGLNTKKGAQGVGAATTNSVVFSMIIIFILNYFLSMLLFPGGGV